MSMERDALLREVDDELQRERLQKLWDEYGTYLVGGVVAVLAGIGGWQWWQGRKAAAAERTGARFEEALGLVTAGSTEEANKTFQAIATSGGASYPVLAQLVLASQAVKDGKTDAAVAGYDSVAARAPDVLIKDFARLQSTALKIDSADFTEIQNRLTDLTAEKSPWRFLARELLGVSAMRAGRLEEAKTALAPLSADPRAPTAVRERAGALMALVVATEQERSAPGKVELEKTDPPASAAAPETPAAKTEPVRPKGAPGRNQVVPRSK